ncbi:MAG: exo-poly-alpha-D-galacturonosidase [Acidobacteria bacterium]|nr:MAG: exo-poly-alpha-D-galacturonosidase [Acidobacteriota bacterium]
MDVFRREFLKRAGFVIGACATAPFSRRSSDVPTGANPEFFDVRSFGATGDGNSIDTPAVNRAIEAAAAAGGGTVRFPAGTYACYSLHLQSNVLLYLEPGATLLAAETPMEGTTSGGYDAAEANTGDNKFQDYGHSHWHNSLIWGEDLHDIGIAGPGRIYGKGLSRGAGHDTPRAEAPGVGNKAIALKNCRNVLLRDFSILKGGHFGILATGVDNFHIDGLTIDTNRDGIDLDCCRNGHVSNCTVNSPWDDAICPKSSFALGYARATENITIASCYVAGCYEVGALLDGSLKKYGPEVHVPRTGRIKFGTESNGGFKNITVSNCVFEGCNGIALESVDGALLEDVTFDNITMRDISGSPIFLRLGARMRGPQGTPVGALHRVILSNIVSYNAPGPLPAIISGIPGHVIEDIKISNVYLQHRGGGTKKMVAIEPPENENKYPDPHMFGPELPAHGFFIRHAKNLEFTNVEIAYGAPDERPAFVITDVDGADFFRIKTPAGSAGRVFSMTNVSDFRALATRGVKDAEYDRVEAKML